MCVFFLHVRVSASARLCILVCPCVRTCLRVPVRVRAVCEGVFVAIDKIVKQTSTDLNSLIDLANKIPGIDIDQILITDSEGKAFADSLAATASTALDGPAIFLASVFCCAFRIVSLRSERTKIRWQEKP